MNKNNTIVVVLVVAVVALVGYFVMTMPDRRSGGEKIGDAITEIENGNGIDNAARELEDRTPAERAKDAVNDATN